MVLRTADDYLWDSINAFMEGDRERSEISLAEAIQDKITAHMVNCLKDVYADATTPQAS